MKISDGSYREPYHRQFLNIIMTGPSIPPVILGFIAGFFGFDILKPLVGLPPLFPLVVDIPLTIISTSLIIIRIRYINRNP